MANRFRSLLITLFAPSLLWLAIAPPIHARPVEKQADDFQLQSVTVTAQKRVENLQDVAISMDAFSGMLIEDAHVCEGSSMAASWRLR